MSEETGPQKYYTIGEASQLTGVAEHILRYWENDKLIRPVRRAGGHRRYMQKDIELIKQIDFLFNKQNITLAGIKKMLHGRGSHAAPGFGDRSESLKLLKELHKDICNILKEW